VRCKELMKTKLHCCSPEDPVYLAAVKMRDEHVGFIPICDESRRVHGTLTDRDITLRVVAPQREYETRCAEVMTKNVVYCSPEDDLKTARKLMAENHVSRILCCDELGSLVGVISLSDLAQEVSDRAIAKTMRDVTEREAMHH
jgi:CBS domain-containing protein